MKNHSLGICSIVDHLDLLPELSAHFFSRLLHLVRSILHEVADILEVALDYDLNILLALVEHGSSLQLFVLFFEQEVELCLLRVHDGLYSLIGLLLQLDPLVG